MTLSQILIHNVEFNLYDDKPIFNSLNLAFSKNKSGLVGRNGTGKSTLLKLILNELSPLSGSIHIQGKLAYVPQNPVFSENMSIAGFLECEEKLNALNRISEGYLDEKDFLILNDEWNLKERLQKGLSKFGLHQLGYKRLLNTLSGGEITRLFLAKAFLSHPDFLLLDEPTNNLDSTARQQLYQAIEEWKSGLIVVSHDRTLLNLMDEIIELNSLGATCYGGHYNEYEKQKSIEKNAKEQQFYDAKKLMLKTKHTIQSSQEKHEQKQSYGRDLRRSGSIDKLAANSKKGRSERTQSKLSIKEARLLHQAETQLQFAKGKIEINEEIHLDLPHTKIHSKKIILDLEALSFAYSNSFHSIIKNFSLKLQGAERVAFAGPNGSGKSTLVKLILKQLQPQSGKIYIGTEYVRYLDQNTTLPHPDSSILENFLQLNPDVKEKDAYRGLANFLFRNISALKLVKNLSGGEKLRALLACVLMSNHPPQLLILDEPTNHLDIDSIKNIESALSHYQGALIVISHDQFFLEKTGIKKIITAPYVQ